MNAIRHFLVVRGRVVIVGIEISVFVALIEISAIIQLVIVLLLLVELNLPPIIILAIQHHQF